MARSEIGTRLIVVENRTYRWRVPRAPVGEDQGLGWRNLTFSVWLVGDAGDISGALLEVEAAGARPDNWLHAKSVVIIPSQVAVLIRRAIAEGWEAALPGPVFRLRDTSYQMISS